MGILGLELLLYFVKNHNATFKKILDSQLQREKNESYYPVATGGIHLSMVLMQIFRAEKGKKLRKKKKKREHSHSEQNYCFKMGSRME
jgi:hypothetical protein